MTSMSSHRPTRPGSRRSPSTSVFVVGLAALIWSCDSEQAGYEVTIPLVGPMELDQTSCEGSGDVCDTDEDCIDEDGFFGGPCTKTMEPLAPITVPVSLSPSNPSFTLDFVDTSGWTNLFLAQQLAQGSVPPGARINMTMDGFSLQGAPVTIEARFSSKRGLVVGQDLGYQPVAPSSCTFTLDVGATGQDFADGINTCLSDWIAQNGSPVDFNMQVISSAGAAAKAAFGPKQLEQYSVSGEWNMSSDSQCDFDGTDDLLEAVREGEGFFAQLACESLTLQGTGQTDQDIDIVGGAAIWDRCGNFSGGILSPTALPGGPDTFEVRVVESGEVVADPLVPVVFIPEGVDFAASLLGAATGKCLSGTPISPDGLGVAGWMHCGPEPPPTRTGSITVNASGFCSVAPGSESAGGSGQ